MQPLDIAPGYKSLTWYANKKDYEFADKVYDLEL